MIDVDHDVPFPPSVTRRRLYPFEKMKVGDSFYIPSLSQTRSASRVYASFSQWKSRYGEPTYTITIRRDEKGIRIWRTK